ncbi:MAG: hypothetical protein ACLPSF_13645 [Methylocella sp.]
MGVVERFEGEFLTLRKRRALHLSLTFSGAGLVLGAGTVLAPMRRNAAGADSLDLSGEDRILAALTATFLAPVDAALLGKLRRAAKKASRRFISPGWRCRGSTKSRRSASFSPTA